VGVAGGRRMIVPSPERREGEHDHDVTTDAATFHNGAFGGFLCFPRCALRIADGRHHPGCSSLSNSQLNDRPIRPSHYEALQAGHLEGVRKQRRFGGRAMPSPAPKARWQRHGSTPIVTELISAGPPGLVLDLSTTPYGRTGGECPKTGGITRRKPQLHLDDRWVRTVDRSRNQASRCELRSGLVVAGRHLAETSASAATC
jgi:hypothetical protein